MKTKEKTNRILPKQSHKSSLSVIIPTLNEKTYLPGLLDALQSQTSPADEIIVADAGSMDGTVELAQMRGVRIVPGGMPGKGRNAGARAAEGDVFLFLDADVLPPQDFLERTLDEFDRNQYVVATCPTEALSDDVTDLILMDATNLYLQMIKPISPRAPGYCIFARRSVHQVINGFDETLKMSEDHDYVRRATQYGEFGILTSVRIPVSMRRLKKEGLVGLALKYLWCEMFALAGKPIHSMPFVYEFGTHSPAEGETVSSEGRLLVDVTELRSQLKHIENPIQRLSSSGYKYLEQLTSFEWLETPLEAIQLQIEAADAAILRQYLVQRMVIIKRNPIIRKGKNKIGELPRESIYLIETYWQNWTGSTAHGKVHKKGE